MPPPLEGKLARKGVAVVKFPSREKMDEFYNNSDYAAGLKNRLECTAERSVALVARAGLHK